MLPRVIAVTVLLTASSAWADGEVGIFPVEGVGTSLAQEDMIGFLVAAAYEEISKQQIVYPKDTTAVYDAAKSPQQAAEALALFEWISLDAQRTTDELAVTAVLHDRDGRELHRVRMTAASMADFQRVAFQLANALFYREAPGSEPAPAARSPAPRAASAAPPQPTTRPRTRPTTRRPRRARTPAPRHARPAQTLVKEKQAPPPKPDIFVEREYGVKLQLVSMLAPGAAYDPAVTVQFNSRLYGERYFLEFGVGLIISSNLWTSDTMTIRRVYGVTGELGISYVLFAWESFASLYAGGGIVPRLVGGELLDLGVKLGLYGQFGAELFRDSSTRMYTDLRINQNVLPFQSFTPQTNRAKELYPTEVTLQLGVSW